MNKFLKIVPILALIIASISLWKSFRTDDQIEALETKYLQDVTDNLADNFTVIRPKNGDTLSIYKDYSYDVPYSELWPYEYQIWLIGRHRGKYYLFDRQELHHNKTKRELSDSGMDFRSEGEWELMLCLVSENGVNQLENKAYGAFDKLPDGIAMIKTTRIEITR